MLFGALGSEPLAIQLVNPYANRKTWDGRCDIGEIIAGKSSWRMQALAQTKQVGI